VTTGERDLAVRIARRLREAGHQALFAGGAARDHLRGKPPVDIDIATSAPPEAVQALFDETIPIGVQFGVVLVVVEGRPFEVATFREDLGVRDGRHPAAVRYVDAEEDARRRDFTINGMFLDPETGAVIDYVGGRRDLEARVVRAIGDPAERFREDRLRMLRAIRFATALDFCVEPATMAAVRAHAPAIVDVSAERIRDELTRLLVSGRGGRGVGLLLEAGLLQILLPEVAALDGVPQPARFHPEGDVLTHTRMLLDAYEGGGEAIALAALLHDIGKAPTYTINEKGRHSYPNHADVGAEMATAILQRLRYPNQVVAQVHELVRRHMVWPTLPKMREAKRRRFLLQEDFADHLELHRLDVAACHRDFEIHVYAREEREKLDREPPPVRPLLSGHDLKAMGFSPGPAFREMLEALVDAQLEGTVGDAAGARTFVLERFRPPDGRPVAGKPGA
jgi:poly(A) polymerase